jgi:hypothetical protein
MPQRKSRSFGGRSGQSSGAPFGGFAPAFAFFSLPLLATGLGALGLLSWWRKQKAQAVTT